MFACLYSLAVPLAALVRIAEDFTPRFAIVGPLVMLDVSGLARLLGTPREIAGQLRSAGAALTGSGGDPVRVAIAPSQNAAALLVLGRAGVTVVTADDTPQVLSGLPVSLLADFDRVRLVDASVPAQRRLTSPAAAMAAAPMPSRGAGSPDRSARSALLPPHVADMDDVLPHFHAMLDRASDAARAVHGGGWMHPRDSHAANQTRRARRALEHPLVPAAPMPAGTAVASHPGEPPKLLRAQAGGVSRSPLPADASTRGTRAAIADVASLLTTLRRWGVRTCGQLAALPPAEVYERLGARGVVWQRLARGDDGGPLVPWIPEEPFEAALDLEWPIEGLEPLSFVLGRLLDPLAERLERADRGVAILHTHLRLVTKARHMRMLQLPAPMRDAKTLRTLILLDLESHPPPAAIDRVQVLVEPTPARVTQWTLFERAQPSPEQVSTLVARLCALMGASHVGSPELPDTWRPGAFAMRPFQPPEGAPPRVAPQPRGKVSGTSGPRAPSSVPGAAGSAPDELPSAVRRFRLPIPARVQVHEGRPVRVATDRRGLTGGAIVQAAGPWRTSGDWWNDAPDLAGPGVGTARAAAWDRDEWDVMVADGTVYRLFVERGVGQWFIEAIVD